MTRPDHLSDGPPPPETRRAAGSSDPLTAPQESIPRRDPSVLTLGDCWGSFARRHTATDRAAVPRSQTARTLGVEAP